MTAEMGGYCGRCGEWLSLREMRHILGGRPYCDDCAPKVRDARGRA